MSVRFSSNVLIIHAAVQKSSHLPFPDLNGLSQTFKYLIIILQIITKTKKHTKFSHFFPKNFSLKTTAVTQIDPENDCKVEKLQQKLNYLL